MCHLADMPVSVKEFPLWGFDPQIAFTQKGEDKPRCNAFIAQNSDFSEAQFRQHVHVPRERLDFIATFGVLNAGTN